MRLQEILCFLAGEDWPIEDVCHGADGAVLNLTGGVALLRIHNGADVDLIVAGEITAPEDGEVHYRITPTDQVDANIVGYAVYYFSVKVTLDSGEITYQNNGLLFCGSDPWAGA